MMHPQRAALACGALLCLVHCDCDGDTADAGRDAVHTVVDAAVDASGSDRAIADRSNRDIWYDDRRSADWRGHDQLRSDGTAADAAPTDARAVDVAGDARHGDTTPIDQRHADRAAPDSSSTEAAAPDSGSGDTGSGDGGTDAPGCTAASGLCIRLTWNTDLTDLDLHLVYNGTEYCSDDSCYWANCKDGVPVRVEWDTVSGISAGDPTIYGDATIGFGPEVIKIEQPLVGSYVVGVYFNKPTSLPETAATVALYDHGAMVGSFSRTLSPDDFWEVLDISVNSLSWDWNAHQRECAGQQPCGQDVDTCPLVN